MRTESFQRARAGRSHRVPWLLSEWKPAKTSVEVVDAADGALHLFATADFDDAEDTFCEKRERPFTEVRLLDVAAKEHLPRRSIRALCGTLWLAASRECDARRVGDAGDDGIKIREDVLIRDAKDGPAEAAEDAIPRGVMAHATRVMGRAVELDDEPRGGASEVHDVIADDQLAAKREAGLRAGKATPKKFLPARGRKAHEARAVLKDARLMRRDETTTENANLRAKGADARRAEMESEIG